MRRSCVLLSVALLACVGVANASAQKLGSEGGSTATTATPGETTPTRDHDEDEDASNARRSGNKAAKPAMPTPRGSMPARPAAPRWHSFLPGMFR